MPICPNQYRYDQYCIFLFLLFVLLSGCGRSVDEPVDKTVAPEAANPPEISPVDVIVANPDTVQSGDFNSWVDRLTDAGFSPDTADKIVERNLISWEILAENDPKELEAQLNQVAKIGKHRNTHYTLQRQPELAGLYAESLKISNDAPQKLDKVFQNPQYAFYFKNFCHLHTLDIKSCLVAAEQYQKNGDIILNLYNAGRSIPVPETYFDANPSNREAIEVYNQFRRLFILDALNSTSQDECDEKLDYIYHSAYELREILDRDDDVRIHFLDSYFPVMKRVAESNRDSELSLLNTPLIFKLLKKQEGEQLLKRHGTAAVNALAPFMEKDPIVMNYAVNAMLNRNDVVLYALDRFRNDKELKNLLSRNISETDKEKLLQEVYENSDGGLKRLQYYDRLSDSALNDDLHPYEGVGSYVPGYAVYKMIRKKINGQDVTVLEVTGAIIDGGFIVTEVALAIPTAGASLSGTALRTAAKQTVEGQLRKVGSRTAELAGKRMAEKELVLGGKKITQGNTSKLLGQVAEQTLAKEGTNLLKLDASPLVRTTFDKARMFGISADKFKKYTGLDARIFMRPDRKVVLNFAALGTLGAHGSFIGIPKVVSRMTAENVVAENVIAKGQEFYLEYTDKNNVRRQKDSSYEEYQSALWLSAATGQLDKAATTMEKK
jgi:hypothetical protein